MAIEHQNHTGRTDSEQIAWERRCDQWDRQEAARRAVVDRQAEADASARRWGEW